MAVVAGLLAGFLMARLAWVLLRGTLAAEVFRRPNYRGHELPTAAGLVLVSSVVAVEAGRAVLGAAGLGDTSMITGTRLLVLLAAVGFAALGLADDLGAVGSARGFRGHVQALAHGRLTTGGLKLFGGGMLALVLAGPAGQLGGREPGAGALWWVLVDMSVIALAANLANLFDRAPGRVIKVGGVGFALLVLAAVLAGELGALAGVAVVVGAALGLLLDDLHERLMLGDTGANALGAVLGVGVVALCAPRTRLLVAVALVALNLASEVVSFSRIIDRVPVLRAIDRAGTLPARRAGAPGRPPGNGPGGGARPRAGRGRRPPARGPVPVRRGGVGGPPSTGGPGRQS